jgi:hypothetical protein
MSPRPVFNAPSSGTRKTFFDELTGVRDLLWHGRGCSRFVGVGAGAARPYTHTNWRDVSTEHLGPMNLEIGLLPTCESEW